MKATITEEFKALCLAVLDDSVDVKHRVGEPDGYTKAELGGLILYGYPWVSAKAIASSAIESGIVLVGNVDGDFYWVHARTKDGAGRSIGCTYSMYGKRWSEQNYFKFPARVALESLRTRLDRGI